MRVNLSEHETPVARIEFSSELTIKRFLDKRKKKEKRNGVEGIISRKVFFLGR